jgi:hypothetical protein
LLPARHIPGWQRNAHPFGIGAPIPASTEVSECAMRYATMERVTVMNLINNYNMGDICPQRSTALSARPIAHWRRWWWPMMDRPTSPRTSFATMAIASGRSSNRMAAKPLP